MSHILETERLILRPVTVHDHTALLTHWTDPEVRRFLFDDDVLSADEVLAVIADSESTFASNGYGIWVIEASGDLAGIAGLRPLEDAGIEIVYSLLPSAWGKGYATEAAGRVLDYALGPLGLREVLAEIDQGNKASVAVIERLGMTPFDLVPGLLGPMVRYRRQR